MSVTRLVRGAAVRDMGLPRDAAGPRIGGGDFIEESTGGAVEARPSTVGESYLGKVVAYVPGEIIAVYVGILGVTTPRTSPARWAAFLGTLALLWTSIVLNNAVARRRFSSGTPGKPGWTKQLAVAFIGSMAFATYVMSLPNSPFGDDYTKVGTILAASLALLLPQIGALLNIDPDPGSD